MIAPLVLGVAGVAILLSLGNWQLRRLAWKEALLAEIETRISADPVALPPVPNSDRDRYLSVRLDGAFEGEPLRVLTGSKREGPGFRVVSAFRTADGRRVLVDRGFVPEAKADGVPTARPARVVGNLDWPDETDGFTPAPDSERNIWFARDVAAMAEALGTEPVLVVARRVDPPDPGVTPTPIDTSAIPNDHLNYAITWFSLAVVWAGMTAYWLWRIRRGGG
ncbi:MAG: SURF1 family protein [Alphaproteobacteria bacterium]|nr:MAG: SURF1 family protein [Alphaproteobacteria bacterium]